MRSRWFFSVLAVLLSFGCGGNGVPMGSISGKVTLDGNPIEKAVIRFTSEGARGARGMVIDGTITNLTTFEVGDGVPVGKHRVTVQESYTGVVDMDPRANSVPFRPVTPLPKHYGNLSRTPLTADVASGTNEFTFELESGR